jgi:hypothetical protein
LPIGGKSDRGRDWWLWGRYLSDTRLCCLVGSLKSLTAVCIKAMMPNLRFIAPPTINSNLT